MFFSPPPPTQFWCSSLTTKIFVATTVTTSAEEKLEIWWLFLCSNWELKAPLHPPVCIPARVCDYGGNVSHEEWVSLWQYRSINRRPGSSDWTFRQMSEDSHVNELLFTKNFVLLFSFGQIGYKMLIENNWIGFQLSQIIVKRSSNQWAIFHRLHLQDPLTEVQVLVHSLWTPVV